jgi:hypothetical protein
LSRSGSYLSSGKELFECQKIEASGLAQEIVSRGNTGLSLLWDLQVAIQLTVTQTWIRILDTAAYY